MNLGAQERESSRERVSPEEILRQHLRSRNLRVTPERLAVLQGVLDREGHFDAEELLEHMRHSEKPVSRATLYRTLDHLAEAGIIKKHRFQEDHALFESVHGREHHDHMVCEHCGSVIEFVNEQIEDLQDEICRKHGFQPHGHVHQIFGLCQSCQGKHS